MLRLEPDTKISTGLITGTIELTWSQLPIFEKVGGTCNISRTSVYHPVYKNYHTEYWHTFSIEAYSILRKSA